MPGLEMRYFVLKPKGDGAYAAASRTAMHAYARRIQPENPTLAAELIEWASAEAAEVYSGKGGTAGEGSNQNGAEKT